MQGRTVRELIPNAARSVIVVIVTVAPASQKKDPKESSSVKQKEDFFSNCQHKYNYGLTVFEHALLFFIIQGLSTKSLKKVGAIFTRYKNWLHKS